MATSYQNLHLLSWMEMVFVKTSHLNRAHQRSRPYMHSLHKEVVKYNEESCANFVHASGYKVRMLFGQTVVYGFCCGPMWLHSL